VLYDAGMRGMTAAVAAVGLVLVAAAPVTSELAGGPGMAKAVPGLGRYAGGEYCITQTPPWHATTTPDSVTLWVDMGNGQTSQAGPYNLSNSDDSASMRSYMDRAVKIEECWEGK